MEHDDATELDRLLGRARASALATLAATVDLDDQLRIIRAAANRDEDEATGIPDESEATGIRDESEAGDPGGGQADAGGRGPGERRPGPGPGENPGAVIRA